MDDYIIHRLSLVELLAGKDIAHASADDIAALIRRLRARTMSAGALCREFEQEQRNVHQPVRSEEQKT